ncbi:hypothetical protein [Nocardioides donggukensis]|uniref:DUF4244 domain-containing protein n=1 Tax=Nocardioides donggukensis TaxID=2774019 RepID=A0A927K205_9ACTN|nr:hypothetical protein [Nocardioides donggukensis]MBD8868764.1 hypothetical protein [Nocardioides donggukensis]
MSCTLLLRAYVALAAPRREERGDVPGWVLITVMTAGLVGALWQFAGPELKSLLADALRQVSG